MANSLLRRCVQSGMGGLLGLAVAAPAALAQIVPDSTLPTNSVVAPGCTVCAINGGTVRGANLFHSFTRFSIPQGGAANFNNPASIQNILTRVTGRLGSNIDGVIGTQGTANLFLINPNGIIFGPNASLNIGGSFVATTANAIQFGNQGAFSASDPSALPLLTINPSALVFNQSSPGRIVSQSTAAAGTSFNGRQLVGLRVPDGKSLLFVGGDVEIMGDGSDGGLHAQGGRIELGGLAGAGEISLTNNSPQFQLGFPATVQRAHVSVDKAADVRVRGNGGGDIVVNANAFTVKGGSALVAGTGGIGRAGDITVNAKVVDLQGDTPEFSSGFFNTASSTATGNAGNILINTDALAIGGAAILDTSTSGRSNAGKIVINARDSVRVDGTPGLSGYSSNIFSRVEASGVGQGGTVEINTDTLALTNSANILTLAIGQGGGGDVTLTARDITFQGFSQDIDGDKITSGIVTSSRRVGNSGAIRIQTGSLSLLDGASFTTLNRGRGNGGAIVIEATGAVNLIGGNGTRSDFLTGIFPGSIGNAGDITIDAGSLLLSKGALRTTVSGNVVPGSAVGRGNSGNITLNIRGAVTIDGFVGGISAGHTGYEVIGNTGNIKLNAGSLSLADQSLIENSNFGQGSTGNIEIRVDSDMTLLGRSFISSSALSPPNRRTTVQNSGQIDIRAKNLTLAEQSFISSFNDAKGNAGNLLIAVDTLQLDNSTIGASSQGGKAGTIQIDARDTVTLKGENANIQSGLFGGVGRGGDITINTGDLFLIDALGIGSPTSAQGAGGNFTFNVRDRILVDSSVILNSADPTAQGNAGDIRIRTGSLALINGSQLSARTIGTGNAGNIIIDARNFISLAGQPASSIRVESTTAGSTGNITITSPRLSISDSSTINASSNSVNGGNINLNIGNLLLLRRGGNVSTTAGLAQAGGDGGNITIRTPQGFIVAVQAENSDIAANAFTGRGGNVNITAQGIYGIRAQPRLTPLSDITASSTLGLSGVVTVNTLGLDPSKGLVPLPTGLADASNQIDQRCSPKGVQRTSSFVNTGTGGIAAGPTDPLASSDLLAPLVPLPQEQPSATRVEAPESVQPQTPQPAMTASADQIIEAQGWVKDTQGKLWLVADRGLPHSPAATPIGCAQNQTRAPARSGHQTGGLYR
jgi:filamentous hemagglutinin family protein